LVVGLGNPGADYRDTRHNLGFRVIERLSARLRAGEESELCGALVGESGELLLARPQTYMNRSGWAVRCLAERFALAPDRCLVIYDEIALPLGRVRLRGQGSPAGHRGMESIVEALQTDAVPRLRVGIAPGGEASLPDDLAPFVLAPFDAEERAVTDAVVDLAADAALAWAADGIELAMARFNGLGVSTGGPLALEELMG
jgi:peptidyl-tRNA hydrolase, PTH1 family